MNSKGVERDAELKEIIKFEYTRLRGIYGYRRMGTLLRRKHGLIVNHKRVYRLMKQLHMQAVIRRKRYKRINYERHTVVDNLLDRNFQAERPNQKWVTDITYLNAHGQSYFLSVMMDLFNNEIVSYQLSRNLGMGFVIQTVKEAITNRPVDDLLIHSDQGTHYTSRAYGQLLREERITQSMSRKGNCLDNACIECFFGHLKSELRIDAYQDLTVLENAISAYVEFYNTERYQSKLGDQSPVEFRQNFLSTA